VGDCAEGGIEVGHGRADLKGDLPRSQVGEDVLAFTTSLKSLKHSSLSYKPNKVDLIPWLILSLLPWGKNPLELKRAQVEESTPTLKINNN
jgi:hypothetical protein